MFVSWGVSYRAEIAEEMLFWRSWFFPTESSSSEENEGKVSRFLFSSSSKRLGLGQLPRARPPFPSLSPNGGGGGGGGGAGDSGRKPPDLQGEVSPLSASIPGEMSKPGGLFPVLRKSKNEATKPALDSESFSSPLSSSPSSSTPSLIIWLFCLLLS